MIRRITRSVLLNSPLEKPARALRRAVRRRGTDCSAGLPHPPTFKTFELPDGLTEDALLTAFTGITIDDSKPGELDGYALDAFYRCIHSWEMVRNETGRCLELGSNPYFITYLLREHTNLDLTLANYFGGEEGKRAQTFTWDAGNGRQKAKLEFDHFNLEESSFPYEDSSFEVVMFCEIIEHLLMNPVHTLKEIRRVLKPGGLLVVTTPNVARLNNVLAMADGLSIYDPYSGFGPYGRHNREFSMHELVQLLKFSGFEPETTFTADAHRADYSSHPRFQEAIRMVDWRRNDLGQYLFAAVRATKQPEPGLPASLFRSYPEEKLNTAW
jgi:SAM-dependent methyltransferase